MTDTTVRQPTWSPQPRPAWVSTLNAIGRNLGDPAAVVSLDEASLLDAARTVSGLDDFGDDGWRTPFGILLRDLESTAELTLTGRLLARIDIVRSLITRLRMAETERLHPEILEQPVVAPIFITGMGRTGTSILLELLGQDPRLRPALGWEYRYPSPPHKADAPTNDRIAKATVDIDMWEQVVPELRRIHENAINEPDEDSMGQVHEFTSGIWSATHRAPNYDAWMAADRMAQALRFHRRLLQHLQWGKPGRWILKNPSYFSRLPSVFAEFPDAHVIMTHRDPLKVLASTADMFATLRWQRSDHVDYAEIVRPMATGYPRALERGIAQRSSGAVPDERFVDVRYADLIRDHLGTLGRLYDQLGMDLTDEVADRMRDYLDAKPKDRHGGRSYQFDDLGLDREVMRAEFASYMDYFNVPEENL